MSNSSMRAVALAAVLLLAACERASATPVADAAAPATGASAEPRFRLTPAAIADAKLETAKVTRAVLEPSVALTGEIAADPDQSAILSSPIPGRIQSVTFIAFVKVGDAFEPREVALGTASMDQLEVISGLAEGEDVVVRGAFTLKSVMLRSTLAED